MALSPPGFHLLSRATRVPLQAPSLRPRYFRALDTDVPVGNGRRAVQDRALRHGGELAQHRCSSSAPCIACPCPYKRCGDRGWPAATAGRSVEPYRGGHFSTRCLPDMPAPERGERRETTPVRTLVSLRHIGGTSNEGSPNQNGCSVPLGQSSRPSRIRRSPRQSFPVRPALRRSGHELRLSLDCARQSGEIPPERRNIFLPISSSAPASGEAPYCQGRPLPPV